MCFTAIIKINHKAIKRVILYEIFVTVGVIKSKLIIVILKKKTGRVFAHGFSCKIFLNIMMCFIADIKRLEHAC